MPQDWISGLREQLTALGARVDVVAGGVEVLALVGLVVAVVIVVRQHGLRVYVQGLEKRLELLEGRK